MTRNILFSWTMIHIFLMLITIPISIVVGDIIAELFFLFVFVFFILIASVQFLYLNSRVGWASTWIKSTALGFFISSTLAIVQIFLLLSVTDLIINHLISLFLILHVTAIFQARTLQENIELDSIMKIWILMHFLVFIVSIVFLALINVFYDLRFDLLIVAIQDYSSLAPWALTGSVFGFIYGLGTGYVLQDVLIEN